jgi:HlyD family secretion protein
MTAFNDSQLPTNVTLVIPPALIGKTRLWKRVIWSFAAAVAVAGVGTAWTLLGRPATTPYRTDVVQRRTILRQVEALGQLDVPERVELSAPAPGRLASILVSPGQEVAKGQLLGQLDETVAALAVELARGSVKVGDSRIAQARVVVDSAKDVGSRSERLAARGLASQADLHAAQSAETMARAALQAARAERALAASGLASASLQRELTAIRAPMNGIVLGAPEHVGVAVSPETGRLFVLGSTMDEMHVVVSVAETDVAEVKPGQLAHFTVPAFAARTFEARVLHVNPDAQRDHSSVTYQVILQAENQPRLLLPGMTANVSIEVARAEAVMAVREAALRFVRPGDPPAVGHARRSQVWRLLAQNRLEAVAIAPGVSDGGYTEARPSGDGPGLVAGDRIVIGMRAPSDPKGANPGPGVKLGRR